MKKSNKIIFSIFALFIALVLVLLIVLRLNATTVPTQVVHDGWRFVKSLDYNASVIAGNNISKEKIYALPKFSSLSVAGRYNVIIKSGDKASVVVTADTNILPTLRVIVTDGDLVIRTKRGINIDVAHPIKVVITSNKINRISVAGRVLLHAKQLNGKHLALDTAGRSDIVLGGKVGILRINTAGRSTVNAKNLIVDEAHISFAGRSDIILHVNNILIANGLGEGSIKYYGKPKVSYHVLGHVNISSLSR